MYTKFALNEAVQVGPWRVARKHLLFVVLFSICIIAFGIIILMTHVFDDIVEEEEEGDNENEEDGDEEESSWGSRQQRFSSGDWVVVAIMVTAGGMAVLATLACFMVKRDTPRRMSSSSLQNQPSVYSVQFSNGETKAPLPAQTYSSPQALPVWSGEILQPQSNSHEPIKITVSANLPTDGAMSKSKHESLPVAPSAPQASEENPPPYAP